MSAELFVDTFAGGGSYDGDAATAYDAFMPPGTVFDDDAVHLSTLRRAGGTGLELGCGTGRFLLRAIQQGLALEGVDRSAAMLERCRGHLDELGIDAVLYHGDIAPLTVDRTFDAIVVTAGTFTLIDDPDRAEDALRSWLGRLRRGGALSMTVFTGASGTSRFAWRLRRTGTDQVTGLTYLVHEATGVGTAPQTRLAYNRLEVFAADGELVRTSLQKLVLRWWQQDELTDLLRIVGFDDVRVFGDSDGWVVRARRP